MVDDESSDSEEEVLDSEEEATDEKEGKEATEQQTTEKAAPKGKRTLSCC